MAGHSKWANIKRHKGAMDAKRSKIFTKIIREITVAARLGGPDPAGNARLRLAIEKAKGQSMPKDNIDRAVKKGSGTGEGSSYDEVTYEGYGPNGVAIIVECMTDNKVRTVAEVRHAFSKNGGNMGESGSVAWMFEKKARLAVASAGTSEDVVMEKALDAGAEDVRAEGDVFAVIAAAESLQNIKDALTQAGLSLQDSGVVMLPKNSSPIADPDSAKKLFDLIEVLEDNDDVQNVWSNEDISDEVMARLG